MYKKSSKWYLLSMLLFIVCAAVSFLFVKRIKSIPEQQEEKTIVEVVDTTPTPHQEPLVTDSQVVVNESVNEAETETNIQKPVRKLTKEELTSIINNVNNNNYPRNVRLKYDNLDTSIGEEYQGSINNLRTWIKSGYCTISVTDVNYDESTGKVTEITIHINRNEQDL